jgi:hypothetical protein
VRSLSSSQPAQDPEPFKPRLNLLTAYPYVTQATTDNVVAMGEDIRWLVDSGAFTAYKIGRTITLDEYCKFIETLPVRPWRYFVLDVIGDPVATMRNYDTMVARGFDPIPIFTRGGSLAELDELYTKTDFVGLGGVAGADPAAYQWLKAVMRHVNGRKVHVLGFASMDWIKYLRPFSCDASSWEAVARYGTLTVYTGFGKFALYKRGESHQAPSEQVIRGLRALGLDPYKLQQNESWTGGDSFVRWASAATWIAASIDIERNLGVKLFLALAANRGDMLRSSFYAVTGRADLETDRIATRARTRRS